MGVVCEAIMKVRPLPQVKIYDSILFHDFETGIKFMHDVSQTKSWPTSIRLVDNSQFQFGSTMKPASASAWETFVESAKKFFVVNVKGFNPDQLAAVTLVFEGDEVECKNKLKVITEIAARYNGMMAGPENGMRGYLLTFLIAYTRDFACDYQVAAESFETSCPWSNVSNLCSRVKKRVMDEAFTRFGLKDEQVWCSFRVTQIYETGAAVYVYLCLLTRDMVKEEIVDNFSIVEDSARDEVMLCGGSISHHHGVGKIRKAFIDRTIPALAIDWQKSIKDAIDPKNIFAINNTIPRSEEEK